MIIIKEQHWVKRGFDWIGGQITSVQVGAKREYKRGTPNSVCFYNIHNNIMDYKAPNNRKHSPGICMSFTILTLLCTPPFLLAETGFSGSYRAGIGIVAGDNNTPTTLNYSRVTNNQQCLSFYSTVQFTSISSNITFGSSVDGLYSGIYVNGAGSDVLVVLTGNTSDINTYVNYSMDEAGMSGEAYKVIYNENGGWSANVPSFVHNASGGWILIRPSNSLPNGNINGLLASEYSLTAKLYIGPNAKPGIYSIPYIEGRGACDGTRNTIVRGSSITILDDRRTCSIAINPKTVTLQDPLMQSGAASLIDNGNIQVSGNCVSEEGITTNGNIQFSIVANNPTSSDTGGVNNALALLNADNAPVARVTFGLQNISSPLNVTGSKYTLPVAWQNFNFDVAYSMFDQGASDTPAYGVGRGTAKFIVEWP